jgi:acyl carrier protein
MLKKDLATYIQDNLVIDGRMRVEESTPLMESGILDSIGLMQLVSYIEDNAGVRISDTDMLPDNFATIDTIADFVARLRQRGPGAR